MQQTAFESAGHSIRLDFYLPQAPGPHPAILVLHGSGGNTGFWLDRIAPFVTRSRVAIFAVHYFDSTNTVRAQPTHFVDGHHVPTWLQTVRDTIAHIARLPAIDPTRIALIGISLGGFLALALGTESDDDWPRIRAILAISAGFVPPWDARVNRDFPPTLLIHGAADSLVPVTQAHAADSILTGHQVLHELLVLPNEGHWFSSSAQLQILAATGQFLAKYLASSSLPM